MFVSERERGWDREGREREGERGGGNLVKDKKVDYKFDSLHYLSVSTKIMKQDEMGGKCNKITSVVSALW